MSIITTRFIASKVNVINEVRRNNIFVDISKMIKRDCESYAEASRHNQCLVGIY